MELLATCTRVLDPAAYDDFGPNGLQVPGAERVSTIVSGVSASAELFERAAHAGAGLVLVHHGLFWKGPPQPLDRAAKRRLQLLFDHDLALAAYHLPLDGHQEHGNAALLAAALGAERWDPWPGRPPLGVLAHLPPTAPADLAARVREATGREPLAFLDGPDPVRTLAIVTGAGAGFLEDAIAAASTRSSPASRPSAS
jgi:putative NIF3 family GTP cyclohydrolase 1 type 2